MSETAEDDPFLDVVNRAPVASAPKTATTEQKALEEKLKTKIPGLELTYGDAKELQITDEEIVKIQEVRRQYETGVHLVRTYRAPYLVRECARIEWRNKFTDWQTSLAKAREQMLAQNKDQNVIEKELDMVLQERVVEWLTIYPKLGGEQLRRLPPGEIETLYQSIMAALGFGQPISPIRL